jgi:PAS domain S-box-containing protein
MPAAGITGALGGGVKRLRDISWRWRIPGVALLGLLPMLTLFSLDDLRHERDTLRRTVTAAAESTLGIGAGFLAVAPSGDPQAAFDKLQILLQPSNVGALFVVDDDGIVLLAAQPVHVGQHLVTVDRGMGGFFPLRDSRRLHVQDENRLIAFESLPGILRQGKRHPAWLVMALDVSRQSQQSADHATRQVLVGGLTLLLGAALAWLWLDRSVTRPLRSLQASVQCMADGTETRSALEHGSGEIRALNRAFARMKGELRQRQQTDQRQRRLYAALSDTNQNIVRATDSRTLLDETCRIAVGVGFRLAWVARLDKVGNMSIAAAAGPAAFRLEGATGEQRLAADPFAAALREGRELIMRFGAKPASEKWTEEARAHGLAGGAAFPLSNAGELVGGLAVMTDKPDCLDPEALEMLREMAGDVAFGLANLDRDNARGRMARRLEEERALLRALVDSIPDLIFFKDHSHVYLGCNRAFEQLVGRKESELLGANEFDLFEAGRAERFRAQDEQVLQTGQGVRFEQWVEYPDGRSVLLDTLKTPFTGPDGDVLGLIGIGRDITDLHRQLEKQLTLEKQLRQTQKMEAVGQLTGGIAHDFNNILASILGFTELARRRQEILDEKLQDYLRRIDLAARRGTDLIAQLLTFSRGGAVDKSIPLEPAPMVKETLKLLRATLPAGIALKTEFAADLPPVVMDPVHLNQVVMNLCINARDALGEQGEITVTLRRRQSFSGACDACGRTFRGDWVELSVVDNGPGISPDHQSRLFEPFFTTKDKGKGSGMGLSVVHGIQNSYGGHVLLESGPGQGTRFRLLYPVTGLQDAPKVADQPVSDETGWLGLQRRRIMVVDDEAAITVYLKEFLEMQGMQVEAYTHSPKALERLQQSGALIDLLITDQSMPDLNGLDLAAQAKRLKPDLPVILCSGFSEGIDAGNAAQHGIDCYLDKPVTPQELFPPMQALIGKVKDLD